MLLRPGGLPVEEVEGEIGPLGRVADDAADAASLAPGRQASHYAPGAPLTLARAWPPAPQPGRRIGLLAADAAGRDAALAAWDGYATVEVLSAAGDPTEAAARLFDALHRLDAAGLDGIVAQPVAETGLGRAVMDRLRRASRRP